MGLVVQQPHQPSGGPHSYDEPGKAFEAVVDHLTGCVAHGDSEDNRGKERKRYGRAEMIELKRQDHFFLPMAR